MVTKEIFKKIALPVGVAIFWITLWQLLALLVNDPYYLPSPIDTLSELFRLFTLEKFYRVTLFTFLRVLAGLASGIVFGCALAILCHKAPIVTRFVTPVLTVIKAMPVATFIVMLLFTISSNGLTVFIGFLMVLPIVFQNVMDGFGAISKNLSEVCDLFELSAVRRFKVLTLPTLLRYLAPAVITSIGLAFKSQVAVEIIIYAKDSIGAYMFDAKYNLNTPEVFAWASVVVTFSLLLEFVTKKLLGRFK